MGRHCRPGSSQTPGAGAGGVAHAQPPFVQGSPADECACLLCVHARLCHHMLQSAGHQPGSAVCVLQKQQLVVYFSFGNVGHQCDLRGSQCLLLCPGLDSWTAGLFTVLAPAEPTCKWLSLEQAIDLQSFSPIGLLAHLHFGLSPKHTFSQHAICPLLTYSLILIT